MSSNAPQLDVYNRSDCCLMQGWNAMPPVCRGIMITTLVIGILFILGEALIPGGLDSGFDKFAEWFNATPFGHAFIEFCDSAVGDYVLGGLLGAGFVTTIVMGVKYIGQLNTVKKARRSRENAKSVSKVFKSTQRNKALSGKAKKDATVDAKEPKEKSKSKNLKNPLQHVKTKVQVGIKEIQNQQQEKKITKQRIHNAREGTKTGKAYNWENKGAYFGGDTLECEDSQEEGASSHEYIDNTLDVSGAEGESAQGSTDNEGSRSTEEQRTRKRSKSA